MRSHVSQAEIDRYRTDGFIVIEDLLTPAETAELADGVARAMPRYGKRRLLADGNEMIDGDDNYSRAFTQRLNLWKIDATVRRYMLGPELGAMAEALAGVRLRVWHDQTLQKMPWANPTAWHLDNPYWSFDSPHAISVWIALEDATLQNGCMWYLPGSHRLVGYDNVGIGHEFGALMRLYPQLATIEPVAAPMRAGSCGFHNGLTAHGAGPNIGPGTRRAMTCAYMPDGSVYNGKRNILGKARGDRLAIGDSLGDDEENPLVG